MNRRIPLRMSLRSLLLAVGLLALGLAAWTQLGMATATFEVWQNDLELDADGQVSGELHGGFHGPGKPREPAWPFRLEVHGVTNRNLLKLPTGNLKRIRYRHVAVWPFSKQDPFERYMERELGIHHDAIVGYVMTDQATNVVINGK